MECKDIEFREFVEKIKRGVESRLEKSYQVSCTYVEKNNGIELVGLIIRGEGQKIVPNIYLNDLYKKDLDDSKISVIVDNVIETYKSAINSEFAKECNIDYSFEAIKDKIYYRVVNYEKNKSLLETIPYKKFLDLAIIFYCLVDNDEEHIASIRITNEHLINWGIEFRDILEYATLNTPKLFPGVIRSMRDVIKDLIMKNSLEDVFGFDNMLCEDSNVYHYKGPKIKDKYIDEMLSQITNNTQCDMYVFTNSMAINGATVMLYNGLIEGFAKRLKSNLYILPSSIHEVIIIPYTDEFKLEDLKNMVKEINLMHVPEGDVLSDSVYIYQRQDCTLTM